MCTAMQLQHVRRAATSWTCHAIQGNAGKYDVLSLALDFMGGLTLEQECGLWLYSGPENKLMLMLTCQDECCPHISSTTDNENFPMYRRVISGSWLLFLNNL